MIPLSARLTQNLELQVGDHAPDTTVLDENGQTVALSALWQDKPVLLTFLRHFG